MWAQWRALSPLLIIKCVQIILNLAALICVSDIWFSMQMFKIEFLHLASEGWLVVNFSCLLCHLFKTPWNKYVLFVISVFGAMCAIISAAFLFQIYDLASDKDLLTDREIPTGVIFLLLCLLYIIEIVLALRIKTEKE